MAIKRIDADLRSGDAARRATARRRAGVAIRPQLVGGAIPAPVRDLLENGWMEVLVDVQCTEGTESDVWQRAVRFPELLIWSVQPKTDAEGKARLKRLIPGLVKGLREGLIRAGCSPSWAEQRLVDLERLHIRALRGMGVVAEVATAPPATGMEEIVITAPLQF